MVGWKRNKKRTKFISAFIHCSKMTVMILFASCEKLPPKFFFPSTSLSTSAWRVLYFKNRKTGSSSRPFFNFETFLVLIQQTPDLLCRQVKRIQRLTENRTSPLWLIYHHVCICWLMIIFPGLWSVRFHEVVWKSGKVQKQNKDKYLKNRMCKILLCKAANPVLEFLNYNTVFRILF